MAGCKTGRSVMYGASEGMVPYFIWCPIGIPKKQSKNLLLNHVKKGRERVLTTRTKKFADVLYGCSEWRLRDGRGDACRVLIFCCAAAEGRRCPDIHFAALPHALPNVRPSVCQGYLLIMPGQPTARAGGSGSYWVYMGIKQGSALLST